MLYVEYFVFWFVLLGSKLVLGAVVIYLLLPKDRQCALCDAELIPLVSPRPATFVLRLMRIQRYWCMECDRHSLGRPLPSRRRTHRTALHPIPEIRVR
jgi:hypothetical protein